MKISNHRLEGVPFKAAHSFGGALTPTLIVLHDTAGRLEKGSSVNWFCSKDCGTSAHVVVERDGSVTQLVPFNRKAFHAGASIWKGREFCNSFSIGIEIVNPGALDASGKAWFHKDGDAGFDGSVRKVTKEHGTANWLPYTPEQIETVTSLCRALAEKYEIEDITAHYIISPKRKVDVGPLFPLEQVRAEALDKAEPVAVAAVAAPRAAEREPPKIKPSALLSDLADQGSRIATTLETARRWYLRVTAAFGFTGAAVMSAKQAGISNGTVDAAQGVANDHLIPILVGLVAALALALVLVIWLGRRYLATAVADGRYVTRPVAEKSA